MGQKDDDDDLGTPPAPAAPKKAIPKPLTANTPLNIKGMPNPADVTRGIMAANKPSAGTLTNKDVQRTPAANAFGKAAEGFKTLQEKGLFSGRKMSR